jgi:hypothetical protein
MGFVILLGAIFIALTAALKSLLLIAMFTLYPRRKKLSRDDLATIIAISVIIASCLIFRDLIPAIASSAKYEQTLGMNFAGMILVMGLAGGIGLTLVVAGPFVSRLTRAIARGRNGETDSHGFDGQQASNMRSSKPINSTWLIALSVLLGLSALVMPTIGCGNSERDSSAIHSATTDIAFSPAYLKELAPK